MRKNIFKVIMKYVVNVNTKNLYLVPKLNDENFRAIKLAMSR